MNISLQMKREECEKIPSQAAQVVISVTISITCLPMERFK